jgi:hypothetical protein
MGDTWYRGQSSTVAPSKAGGSIHDFGDGTYLTNSKEVAETYASTRAKSGGQAQVLTIHLERADLGRVLDLHKDPRWERFLQKPLVPNLPHTTPERLIKGANENYGRFFMDFVRQNNISLKNYDAVIGPEFVRGGSQLCLLHRDGQPSALAVQIRLRLQPVGAPAVPAPASAAPKPRVEMMKTQPPLPESLLVNQSRARGVVGNQAAMAVVGQLIGGAIQSLGDIGIRRRVESELRTTHAGAIERILGSGQGVLVIMRMQEWNIPDFSGNRARALIGVSVQGGESEDDALYRWRATPRLLAGPANGWRSFEQYAWMGPAG